MNTFRKRSLALAGLLAFSFSTQAQIWGSDNKITPSVNITPAKIALDIPMSINSGDLTLLLAQASSGNGLADLKAASVRKYTQHLHSELARQLSEHFADEEVPLVKENGSLELSNSLTIKVVKHLSAMESRGYYDEERGFVELSGEYYYQLRNHRETALREQRVDIGKLKVREKYLTKTPHNGDPAQDNTEQVIKQALSQLVKRLIKEVDDNLEEDQLREMATL